MEKYIITDAEVKYMKDGSTVWTHEIASKEEREEIIEHLQEYAGSVEIQVSKELMTTKELKKNIVKITKKYDVESLDVKVFEAEDHDSNVSYFVEVGLTGDSIDEVFNIKEMSNEKEALKAAKRLLKTLVKAKETAGLEILEEVEVYHA